MKIPQTINTYCAKCGRHTPHKVALAQKNAARGMCVGNRRRSRKLKGYIGKVKGQATVKKISKRQKVVLRCNVCNTRSERVIGTRAKARLEVK